MQIADALSLIERIPNLEQRIKCLEVELAEARQSTLAEWVTLREACAYAGQSYNTLRRPEYRDRRPDSGRQIRGRVMYPQQAVIEWSKRLGNG